VPIYALGALEPQVHDDAFVHPDAVVIGNVLIGAGSSVWPGAVLRGDGFGIVIGARTSIQDNAVVHNTEDIATVVGDDCTIGHLVHLEGCTIENGCLVGVGAVVLHRVIVRSGAIVASNAVVLDDMEVPSGALALGVPARIREGAANPDLITGGAQSYLERSRRFRAELRRLD
jgi:carbonic anhydrase/acetyltransferase-like protein (isoleucine patch superfamily)